MPSAVFSALLALLAFASTAIAEVTPQEKPGQRSIEKLPDKDAPFLAEACRITALINDGNWEELTKLSGREVSDVDLLKHYAARKDWQGIGAYRGFQTDPEKPREVIFRFGFGPKSSPHELRIQFTDGDRSKPRMSVLGW
jgi:hypothetical protein